MSFLRSQATASAFATYYADYAIAFCKARPKDRPGAFQVGRKPEEGGARSISFDARFAPGPVQWDRARPCCCAATRRGNTGGMSCGRRVARRRARVSGEVPVLCEKEKSRSRLGVDFFARENLLGFSDCSGWQKLGDCGWQLGPPPFEHMFNGHYLVLVSPSEIQELGIRRL